MGRLALLIATVCLPAPATAKVTITFWSHELGNEFPHAFITMRGQPDAGGPPVDFNIGFTPKQITPAILFGSVSGMLEPASTGYMRHSDAQFSVELSDAQYVAALQVIRDFGPAPEGSQRYNMNHRNCVTFVQFVAERIGLKPIDNPALRKKPRSFLQAVEAANPGAVEPVHRHGNAFIAALSPVPGLDPKRDVLSATGTISPALALSTNRPTAPPEARITEQSMAVKQDKLDTAKAEAPQR